MLGSDGIFDKMTDEDVGKSVWLSCEAARNQLSSGKEVLIPGGTSSTQTGGINVHQYCGLGVEAVLKNSLYRQSLDNVTVVMVAF